ncbi:MAG: hypothetical protein V3U31_04890 [Dehalococcoidia bacterium]
MGHQDPVKGAAFYALGVGAWRDYVTLLHIPYTLWHLSYVAIGAAMAPALHADRLGWSLLAFFLALGIGAHALDELGGRPLRTRIPRPVLLSLAAVSVAAAVGLGVVAAATVTVTIVPFILFGVFIVFAYNMELFGGRFHSDLWFALSWGAFPMLTGYWVNSQELNPAVLVVAAFCFVTSLAQRRLSSRARWLRRRVDRVEGTVHLLGGGTQSLDRDSLLGVPEVTLKLLALSMVLLAAGLVAWRLGV